MTGLILPASYVAERQRKQQQARVIERRIAEEVKKAYPGHVFTITVEIDNGNVFIDHPLMAHAKGRYFVNTQQGETIKDVLRMCGEILERVNILRGAGDMAEYDDKQELAKTAFAAR